MPQTAAPARPRPGGKINCPCACAARSCSRLAKRWSATRSAANCSSDHAWAAVTCAGSVSKSSLRTSRRSSRCQSGLRSRRTATSWKASTVMATGHPSACYDSTVTPRQCSEDTEVSASLFARTGRRRAGGGDLARPCCDAFATAHLLRTCAVALCGTQFVGTHHLRSCLPMGNGLAESGAGPWLAGTGIHY